MGEEGITGDVQQLGNNVVDAAQQLANGVVDLGEEAIGTALSAVSTAITLLGQTVETISGKVVGK